MSGKNTAGLRHRNMPLLLLQSRERVLGRFRPLLNEAGLTEQQWRIIRLLLDTAPLEPRQIGEQCGILSPSLTGILERMEELRLIKRERLAQDQRRVHVTPSARARALAERLAPAINAAYDRIEAQVGAELWARVQATLDELLEALSGQASELENSDSPSGLQRSPLARRRKQARGQPTPGSS